MQKNLFVHILTIMYSNQLMIYGNDFNPFNFQLSQLKYMGDDPAVSQNFIPPVLRPPMYPTHTVVKNSSSGYFGVSIATFDTSFQLSEVFSTVRFHCTRQLSIHTFQEDYFQRVCCNGEMLYRSSSERCTFGKLSV